MSGGNDSERRGRRAECPSPAGLDSGMGEFKLQEVKEGWRELGEGYDALVARASA